MSDSENTDTGFEEFIEREARAYNAPPKIVPRDAMWSAIQAARAAARPDAPRFGDRSGIAGIRRRRVSYGWIGMAATLVLGVAIGRYAFATRTVVHNAPSEVTTTDTSTTSYLVATSEHLARAEALLTVFATSTPDPATDLQLASWARDVLSNTRLLLDSPASHDPSRRRLLEDLERVLVEIVQRSPAANGAEERSHVERSLERTQVLPRLRSAQLAGVNSGT